MRPSEITATMRTLAIDARCAAGEAHTTAVIAPLVEAIEMAADLLEHQQRFLIELRNHKADAS